MCICLLMCLVDKYHMHDHLCTSVLLRPYSSTKKSLVSFVLALLSTRLMRQTESLSFSFTMGTFTFLFSCLNSQFCLCLSLFLFLKSHQLCCHECFQSLPPFSSPILPNSYLYPLLNPPSSPQVTYIIILSFCQVLTAVLFHRVCVHVPSCIGLDTHISPFVHRRVHEILARAYFKYSDPSGVRMLHLLKSPCQWGCHTGPVS